SPPSLSRTSWPHAAPLTKARQFRRSARCMVQTLPSRQQAAPAISLRLLPSFRLVSGSIQFSAAGVRADMLSPMHSNRLLPPARRHLLHSQQSQNRRFSQESPQPERVTLVSLPTVLSLMNSFRRIRSPRPLSRQVQPSEPVQSWATNI